MVVFFFCRSKSGVPLEMSKSFLTRASIGFLGFSLIISTLSACVSIDKEFGYFPSRDSINKLGVGSFKKAQVNALIGPAAISEDDSWIYIGSNISTTAFLSPKVVDRDILLLQFNDKDILVSKDIFTIADGKIFNISTSKEIEDPRKSGVIRQLFGNLTKFSPENFVSQN